MTTPTDGHLVRAGTATIRSLGATAGMERLYVDETRLAPGEHATIPPGKLGAERFVFVVSGRGVIRTSEGSVDVAAGDFVGASEPLVIDNPHEETLVYLSGGENS